MEAGWRMIEDNPMGVGMDMFRDRPSTTIHRTEAQDTT
jgi:hypothetical protein